jgi:tryptophanyl-tRNA synthetase
MREFLEDHQEKREEAAELLADLDINLDVGASRRGVTSDAD